MLSQELVLEASVGLIDGRLQGGQRGVDALRQVAVLDDTKDGLDLVQLRRVRWQEVEVNALGPELGQGGLDHPAMMQTGIVQHDHQRDRARGPLQQEVHQIGAGERARGADPIKGGLHAVGGVQREGVVAPPLGVLVGHVLALAGADPAHRYRKAGAEAALIEVDALEEPRGGPFPNMANCALARSTLAGSCLWRSERTVRRHLAPMPWRYRRVCRVLSRMPSSWRAWASCVAVQVRGWSNSRSRAWVTCSRRAVSGG